MYRLLAPLDRVTCTFGHPVRAPGSPGGGQVVQDGAAHIDMVAPPLLSNKFPGVSPVSVKKLVQVVLVTAFPVLVQFVPPSREYSTMPNMLFEYFA